MTAVYVTPDKEWVEEWLTVGFEAPAEIGRVMDSPLTSLSKKDWAAQHLAKYAYSAVKQVLDNPKAFGFEIKASVAPQFVRKDMIQETLEEVETRRIQRLDKPAITDVQQRDMENWTIQVYGKRRKAKFFKHPPQFGRKDGFEEFDDLPPEWQEQMQPVYVQEED